jgi:hypothetical protein
MQAQARPGPEEGSAGVSSVLDQRIVRLRKYGEQLTCAEIARELGIPETRVYSALRRAGLQRQYRGMDKRSRRIALAPGAPLMPAGGL